MAFATDAAYGGGMVNGEPPGGLTDVTVLVDDAADITFPPVNWSNVHWEAAWIFTEPRELHLSKHADPEWA